MWRHCLLSLHNFQRYFHISVFWPLHNFVLNLLDLLPYLPHFLCLLFPPHICSCAFNLVTNKQFLIWCGHQQVQVFTLVDWTQQIESFIWQALWLDLYDNTNPTVTQLVKNLFRTIHNNSQHVLYHLLLDKTKHSYTLRPCQHDCFPNVKANSGNSD